MLETASRIHSANGGVRASQARDDDPEAFTDAACVSSAILYQIASEKVEYRKQRSGEGRRKDLFERASEIR